MIKPSPFRYSKIEKYIKKTYRLFNPVPKSPWTAGAVEDICAINLVPPETLVSFFENCIHILQERKGPDIGDYLEFGVFNGNSIGSMHAARNNTHIMKTRLFGFDAFEGLPSGSENEDDGVWKTGFYECSYTDMQHCLLGRNVDPDDITFVKGWYNETLTNDLATKFDIGNFGIVFIDYDTYSLSKTVLDFIAPRINSPLIICLDDWKLNNLDIKAMGEYQSFNEFVEANPTLQITKISSYNRKSKSFLIEPS